MNELGSKSQQRVCFFVSFVLYENLAAFVFLVTAYLILRGRQVAENIWRDPNWMHRNGSIN